MADPRSYLELGLVSAAAGSAPLWGPPVVGAVAGAAAEAAGAVENLALDLGSTLPSGFSEGTVDFANGFMPTGMPPPTDVGFYGGIIGQIVGIFFP